MWTIPQYEMSHLYFAHLFSQKHSYKQLPRILLLCEETNIGYNNGPNEGKMDINQNTQNLDYYPEGKI